MVEIVLKKASFRIIQFVIGKQIVNCWFISVNILVKANKIFYAAREVFFFFFLKTTCTYLSIIPDTGNFYYREKLIPNESKQFWVQKIVSLKIL